MVKSKLIQALAKKFPQLPEKDVAASINLVLELMTNSLGKGERIEIRGFGSFTLHYRAPRKAHNPKTGEKVYTEAKHSPHFKPGKELRDRVNASRDLPIRPMGEEAASTGTESD